MRSKTIGIFILSLLLIVGLIQIDATGALNPIFHSIAASVRRMVGWVWAAYSPHTVILAGEQEFLNADGGQDEPSIFMKESPPPQHNTEGVELERPAGGEDSVWDSSRGDFSDTPQAYLTDESASRRLQLLQEIVEPEDPVTDLFPETEWYDEVDFDASDFAELLTTKDADEEIQSDNALDSDVVQPLLDEIKSQIQQKLESDPPR